MPLVSAAVVLAGAASFRRQGRRSHLATTLIAVGHAELVRLDAALGVHWPSLFATLKGGIFGHLLTLRGEGQRLAPTYVAAPHPGPLPAKSGERERRARQTR